tara:strand:+ start:32 stop:262 length:231 start_codon:yes stop_codon:yes gene_type:complete
MKRKLLHVSQNFTNLNPPENHLDLLPKKDLHLEEKLQEKLQENHQENHQEEKDHVNYPEENQENHHVNLQEEDNFN